MTLLAALLALHVGIVTPADAGVFERVAERRAQWGQTLPRSPVACLAALNDPDRLGRFVLVLTPIGLEACYVVDCAEGRDAIERKTYNEVLEIDWQTWQKWDTHRVAIPRE